ncbi:MAG: hypothetical protein WKF78_14360 [Candidatus Limnocylindrales bacterium]
MRRRKRDASGKQCESTARRDAAPTVAIERPDDGGGSRAEDDRSRRSHPTPVVREEDGTGEQVGGLHHHQDAPHACRRYARGDSDDGCGAKGRKAENHGIDQEAGAVEGE